MTEALKLMKNRSLSNRVIFYVCTFIFLTLFTPLECFGQIWYFIPEDQNCVPIMFVRDTAGDYWIGYVPRIYSKGIDRMNVLQMKLKENPNTFVNLFNNPNKGFSETGNRRFAFEDNWYSQESFWKLEIQKMTPTEIVFYKGFSVTVDYSTMVAGSERFVLHSYSVDDIVNGRFHTRDTFDYHTTRGISDSSPDTPMNNQRSTNNENSWNKSRTC